MGEKLRNLFRSWSVLQTGTIALLSIACLAMAGIIYAELTSPVAASEDPVAPAVETRMKGPSKNGSARFSMASLQSFAAITDRPLFSQSRHPPVQGSSDSLGPWSAFTLAGIIISPTSREVLILHGKPPALVHLQEGQDVEGWVVTSILPDRIVLRGGDVEHELKLLEKPAPSPPVTPIAPGRRFNP